MRLCFHRFVHNKLDNKINDDVKRQTKTSKSDDDKFS